MQELLTPTEVSKILKVSYRTVLRLIGAAKLKAITVRGQFRVRQDDLAEYLKKMEV